MMLPGDSLVGNSNATFKYQFSIKFLGSVPPAQGSVQIDVLVSDPKSSEVSCTRFPSTAKVYSSLILSKEQIQANATTPLQVHIVKRSGLHSIRVQNMFKVPIEYSGWALWENPSGFLSADLYGYLPFYMAMSGILILAASVWLGFSVKHCGQLLQLQYCISAVLAVTIVEFALWYLYYFYQNATGNIDRVMLVVALLVTVLRRAASRMLVVAVSYGFGMVRPTLSKSRTVSIMVVGFVYFIAEALNEIFTHYGHMYELSSMSRLMIVSPSMVLNAIYYWWIFTALSNTLTELKQQGQEVKLQMQIRFSQILTVSLFVATAFAVYMIYFLSNWFNHHWMWTQRWFVENGFWQTLYTVMLLSIMLVWRPTARLKDAAYAFQITQREDDFGDDVFCVESTEMVETLEDELGEESPKDTKIGNGSTSAFTIDIGEKEVDPEMNGEIPKAPRS